jgi:hypothetical protein
VNCKQRKLRLAPGMLTHGIWILEVADLLRVCRTHHRPLRTFVGWFLAWWKGTVSVEGGSTNRPSPQSPKGILGSTSPVITSSARGWPLATHYVSIHCKYIANRLAGKNRVALEKNPRPVAYQQLTRHTISQNFRRPHFPVVTRSEPHRRRCYPEAVHSEGSAASSAPFVAKLSRFTPSPS